MVPLAFFASVFIGTIKMAGTSLSLSLSHTHTHTDIYSILVSVGMMVFVIGLIIISLLGRSHDFTILL